MNSALKKSSSMNAWNSFCLPLSSSVSSNSSENSDESSSEDPSWSASRTASSVNWSVVSSLPLIKVSSAAKSNNFWIS